MPVGPFLAEAVRRYGRPQAIAADRWRAGELQDGVRDAQLALPEPTWRGQGWRDGAQDVRQFRAAVLEGQVAAPVSLAMRAAFAEAKVVSDAAANEKIAKAGEGQHRRRGRDDLAAGIVLAVAEGVRRHAAKPVRAWRYRAPLEPIPRATECRALAERAPQGSGLGELAVRALRSIRERGGPHPAAAPGRRPVGGVQPSSDLPHGPHSENAGRKPPTADACGASLAAPGCRDDRITIVCERHSLFQRRRDDPSTEKASRASRPSIPRTRKDGHVRLGGLAHR